jgi:hypothetical protein
MSWSSRTTSCCVVVDDGQKKVLEIGGEVEKVERGETVGSCMADLKRPPSSVGNIGRKFGPEQMADLRRTRAGGLTPLVIASVTHLVSVCPLVGRVGIVSRNYHGTLAVQ